MKTGVGNMAALAAATVQRRDKLRVTQKELAQLAGVSIDVIQAIEGMEERQLRPGTKKKLEDGMRLEPGSIDDVLHDRGPFKEHGSADVDTVEQPFDPMTASNEQLGKHADWLSQSSKDPTLGARWMAGVLQRRLEVAESLIDSEEGDQHAM